MVMSAFTSARLLAVFIVILSYVCSTKSCLESERQALLMFKGGLVDEYNKLGSWVDVGGGNCCDWYGISCNNSTGHVVGLNLNEISLRGVISSAIGNLTSLTVLILDGSSSGGLEIGGRETLKSMGQLCHLKHLGLSWVKVNQDVVDVFHDLFSSYPSNSLEELNLESCGIFGNLTNVSFHKFKSLVTLYLRNNSISGSIPLSFGELQSLENVYTGENSMAGVISEAHFQKLDKLKTFSAESNKQLEMEVSPSWIPPFQLTKLDLGSCQLGKHFPHWLRTRKDMQYLDLSYCGIEDTIPSWFWNMSWPLKYLSLAGNNIFGEIPSMAGQTFLEGVFIYLDSNQLTGQVPIFSSKVQVLDLSYNSFEYISKEFWNSTSSLTDLYLSNNRIVGEIPSMAGQAFSERVHIYLDSNQLTGQVPIFSSKVQLLDLSNNSFEYISKEFWNSTSSLMYLTLSNNRIVGEIPSMAGETFQEGVWIYLGSNQLTGQVPIFSSKVQWLDLSNNSFESISKGFWNSTASLSYLVLANNRIVGEIPSSRPIAIRECGMIDLRSNYFTGQVPLFSSNLYALDLSNNSFIGSISHFLCHETNESKELVILNLGENLLFGEIPNCWNAWKSLRALRLNNNNFTGGLPSSMQNLTLLQSVHVRNNSLRGELSLLLRNTQKLVVVDLAENQLEGEIPAWIGESNRTILDLRSNKFHDKIPDEVCSMASLQILDFASNNLTGNIPHCINKLQSLVTGGKVGNFLVDEDDWVAGSDYAEEAIIVMKGRVMEYGNTLNLVRLIDLSDNSLSGDIPAGVTTLVALQSLNLSRNFLTGEIPQEIGTMKEIESLDLSMNKLSGQIPESITNLTFLSSLDLSSNNLTGAIPLSTQLQGFDASCFTGNDLCGLPLAKSCTPITGTATGGEIEHGHPDHVKWFWVSTTFGFVLGFWVVVFPMFYSRRWRFGYFSVLDRIWAFLLVIFGRYHRF